MLLPSVFGSVCSEIAPACGPLRAAGAGGHPGRPLRPRWDGAGTLRCGCGFIDEWLKESRKGVRTRRRAARPGPPRPGPPLSVVRQQRCFLVLGAILGQSGSREGAGVQPNSGLAPDQGTGATWGRAAQLHPQHPNPIPCTPNALRWGRQPQPAPCHPPAPMGPPPLNSGSRRRTPATSMPPQGACRAHPPPPHPLQPHDGTPAHPWVLERSHP